MADLLPCPFCGRIPKIESYKNEYWIVCKCGIELGHLYKSKQAAVNKWNRRKNNA